MLTPVPRGRRSIRHGPPLRWADVDALGWRHRRCSPIGVSGAANSAAASWACIPRLGEVEKFGCSRTSSASPPDLITGWRGRSLPTGSNAKRFPSRTRYRRSLTQRGSDAPTFNCGVYPAHAPAFGSGLRTSADDSPSCYGSQCSDDYGSRRAWGGSAAAWFDWSTGSRHRYPDRSAHRYHDEQFSSRWQCRSALACRAPGRRWREVTFRLQQ